jgi:S1-C subfamily serine protease
MRRKENTTMKTFLLMLLAVLSACQASVPRQAQQPSEQPTAPLFLGALWQRNHASVVDVIAHVSYRSESPASASRTNELLLRAQPFSREVSVLQKSAAGVVLDDEGLILTNAHTVSDAEEVIVRLWNQETYLARVIGTDRETDVALLQIDATDLPAANFGRSARLHVGEWVAALGSPEGFPGTVTTSVVSAMQRHVGESAISFIQTDVAAYRTNAGGPLVNASGEIVGLSSDCYAQRSAGESNARYAIPIELAIDVAKRLRRDDKTRHGFIEKSGFSSLPTS